MSVSILLAGAATGAGIALLGLLATLVTYQRVRKRKETRMPAAKCPGRLDIACTCTGTCQSAGPGGSAAPCKCLVCSKHVGSGLSPLASFKSQTPLPRGSGSGMTGFAEAGELDFTPEFDMKPVTGLRQWTLDGPDFRTDPHEADRGWPAAQLRGATGFGWPAGVLEAACNNGHKHQPPAETDPDTGARCGCGFWAYWDMSGLASNRFAVSGRGLPVLGVVAGFGRVLIGEKGFRSEKAKIVALAPAFSIQAEVPWQGPPSSRWDQPALADPLRDWAEIHAANSELDEVRQRAQRHADAWMAVIQDRLGQMYPGARVYATAGGLLASVKIEGKPR